MMNLVWRPLAVALALGFSAAALAVPNNQELKIGIAQEFETLNPINMTMAATTYMVRMVNRSLAVLDADAHWVPELAKQIPTIENGGAKLTTINGKKTLVAVWEIRDEANWGDGQPVTCEDFAFTRDIAASPNVSVGEKEVFTQHEKIEWDPKTPKKCTITYDRPRWDYYQNANFIPVPKHIEGATWTKYGSQKEAYEKNSNYVKNPTNPGLYCGAYVINDVKLGDHVSFVPNTHFYGEKPKIQKIVVKLIPNTGTLEANLRSGTIDMISPMGLTLDQAISLEKKVKTESLPYKVDIVPSFTYEHIDLNLDNPILKDIRVRKALAHAINREDIVKALFDGKQTVAQHFSSPKDPWFTADPKFVTTYRYSKHEAQKLLDEAGWKVGADGMRLKDGKKLTITFMTTAGDKTRELVQTYLQNQWKQVGFDIVIKNQPAKVFFPETVTKRNFTGMVMYAWTSAPENSPRSTLHSSSIPASKNGYSGQNSPGWINASVDKDIDALDGEFDAKKRMELAWELQKLYTAELPVLPLYYRSDVTVVPTTIKGYKMTGHQFYETDSVEKWTLQ